MMGARSRMLSSSDVNRFFIRFFAVDTQITIYVSIIVTIHESSSSGNDSGKFQEINSFRVIFQLNFAPNCRVRDKM